MMIYIDYNLVCGKCQELPRCRAEVNFHKNDLPNRIRLCMGNVLGLNRTFFKGDFAQKTKSPLNWNSSTKNMFFVILNKMLSIKRWQIPIFVYNNFSIAAALAWVLMSFLPKSISSLLVGVTDEGVTVGQDLASSSSSSSSSFLAPTTSTW